MQNKRNKTLYQVAGVTFGLILSIVLVAFIITNKGRFNTERVVVDNKVVNSITVINTNKSVYKLQEKVEFGFVSVGEIGNTVCNSDIRLSIINPSGKRIIISSKDGEIQKTTTCSEDNSASAGPDYLGYFIPLEVGEYKFSLIDTTPNNNLKEGTFKVVENYDIEISRSGATRINPYKSDRVSMVIIVTANKDIRGELVEKIPAVFDVVWQGSSKVENVGDFKTIKWGVNVKAGESKEFIYEYRVPKISSISYELSAKVLDVAPSLWRVIASSI